MRRLWPSHCERRGHEWLLSVTDSREFVVTYSVCVRCRVMRVILPWGRCLGGHPIAEHYDNDGELMSHPYCEGPK